MTKTIMVIDDSPSIRKAMQTILENSGHIVILAEDGEDALNKLQEGIDLIFCDVNMPKIDGLSFVKAIKNDLEYKEYRYIPIVMLTTESGEDKKSQGQIAGAKAWMVKPFLPERVLMVVEKLA